MQMHYFVVTKLPLSLVASIYNESMIVLILAEAAAQSVAYT